MVPFDLTGKTAVVIGGGSVLGGNMAWGLGKAGAELAIVSRKNAGQTVEMLKSKRIKAKAYSADAMNKESVAQCCQEILNDFKTVDILLNCVGGNQKEATTSPDQAFFDIPLDVMGKVVALNLFAGAIVPAQVFAKEMVKNPKGGSIINVSSMNAFRPLTRIAGYSAAKAAVSNFTQWLAVHLAKEYNPKLRVNAIAPGFFLTEQNNFLLKNINGGLTDRGKDIIAHTPMGRFGNPEDLEGTVVWLASDASEFVTGIVVPVDGGFSAYSGV
jgi:NAD(P)-dependent dehydrogenase (short-subunit alcohol dehydrogenase family)